MYEKKYKSMICCRLYAGLIWSNGGDAFHGKTFMKFIWMSLYVREPYEFPFPVNRQGKSARRTRNSNFSQVHRFAATKHTLLVTPPDFVDAYRKLFNNRFYPC